MAIEKIGIDIKGNLVDVKKQLSDIDDRIKQLKTSKPKIQLNADKLETAKKRIESINLQLKELTAKKADIKANTKNVDEAKKKIAEVNDRMNKLRSVKANLQVTTERLKGADRELKNLNKEMQQLNNKKAYLQVDSQNIAQTESKLSSLKSKLSELGTRKTKIDISSNMDKLGTQLDGIGNKMLSVFNPLGSKINQMIGFGAIMRGVDGAINMVSNSVGGAIKRFDTLNNSTRSFENMGIAADVVKTEIENLKTSVNGLPTPIDGAISNVQLLTASTNDMSKSVKVFRAMNDGILGFGGNVEMVDNAVVQLSQSFSNGKIDAQTWNSMINSGLGPSLNAMAKKMDMTTGQMKEALSEGTISVEQFQDALIDLDENGGAGMKSLQTIVKDATSGIQTGIANMKTAVVRGSASIIKTTDNILKSAGFNGFAGVFGSIGEMFEKNLTKVSTLLEQNQDKIIAFVKTVKKQFEGLDKFDKGKFFEGLREGLDSAVTSGKSFINTIKPLLDMAKNLITKLGDGSFEKGLGKLPALLLKSAIGFKVLGKSLKLLALPLKLVGGIKLPSLFKGKEGLATTFDAFKGNLFDGLTSFAKNAGNLVLVFGAIKILEEAAEAMKQLDDKMPSDFKEVAKKVAGMSLAIGSIGALAFIAGKLPFKEMAVGLIAVAAISLEIMLAAEALNQLNEKVPSSIKTVAKKLANVGIAIGGMALLVGVIGGLSLVGWPVALAGLASVALLAGELMLVSEAIKQLDDKVPTDFDGLEGKLKTITSVLDSIIESNFSRFGALFDAIIAGFTTESLDKTLSTLISIAEKLKTFSSKTKSLDAAKITKSIKGIKNVMEELALEGNFFTSLGRWFKGKIDTAVFENTIDSLNKLIGLANKVSDFGKIKISMGLVEGNLEKIQKTLSLIDLKSLNPKNIKPIGTQFVTTIKKSIESLTELADTIVLLEKVSMDVGKAQDNIVNIKGAARLLKSENWSEFDKGLVGANLLTNIRLSIESLTSISKEFVKLLDATPEVGIAQDALVNIKGALRMLKAKDWEEFNEGYVTSDVFGNVTDTITVLSGISGIMKEIDNNKVEVGSIQDIIINIKGALRMLKLSDWAEYSEGFIDKNTLEPAILSLDTIKEITEKLDELSKINLVTGSAQDVLVNLKGAIRMLKADAWAKDFESGFVDKNTLEPLTLAIDTLSDISESLVNFAGKTLDSTKINDELVKIKGGLRQFTTDKWSEFDGNFVDSFLLQNMGNTLDIMYLLMEKISALAKPNIDITPVQNNITYIMGVLNRLKTDNYPLLNETITADYVDSIDTVIYRLITLGNRLSKLQQVEFTEGVIFSKIESMRRIITWLNDFPAAKGVDSAEELINTFIKLGERMSGLASNFNTIGKGYGEELINGFKNANVSSTLISLIDKLVKDLKGKNDSFTAVGKGWGNATKNAFATAIAGLVNAVTSQIVSLNAQSSSFATIGSNYGRFLLNGFNKSVASLSESIGNQVKSVQTSLNSLSVPALNAKVRTNGRATTLSTGGEVPEYLASGGSAGLFKRKGTDTVPAMLTPGEFVHKRAAVSTFGYEFMNRVNNLDVQGAFKALTSRFNNRAVSRQSVSSVVNNINNSRTNNAKVVQNIYSDSQNYNSLGRMRRELGRI